MIRKILLAVSMTVFTCTTTACNTVKGLGRDIESVGQAGDDLTHLERPKNTERNV